MNFDQFWLAAEKRIRPMLRPYLSDFDGVVEEVGTGENAGKVKVRRPTEEIPTSELLWSPVYGAVPTVGAVVFVAVSATGNRRVITGGGGTGGTSYTLPDASTTTKGGTKLSVAPATATDPVAAGTNDPRMNDARTPTLHGHAGADITSGTVDVARIGTGTKDTTTFYRGDGTFAAPPSGGSSTAAGFYEDGSWEWVSATQYRVLPGRGLVNGTLLDWSTAITRTPTRAASTVYYVYFYDAGSSVAAATESTTAPAWDRTLQYHKLPTDATRRCVGWYITDASSNIERFVVTGFGRSRELVFVSTTAGNNRVVDGGTLTGSWGQFSLSFGPAHATHWYAAPKLQYSVANGDAILGISPLDMGTLDGRYAPYTVRAQGATQNSYVFFGRAWLPQGGTTQNYYRIFNLTGANNTIIEYHGARVYV